MRRPWVGWVAVGMLIGSSAFAEVIVEERRDLAVELKGGVGAYTGGLSNSLGAGPVWGVAADLQPFNMVGFELGYEGSLNPIYGAGSVVRNGASALLKLSPPFTFRVKPFLGAGLGASVVSSVNAASSYNGGLMGELPLAAGVEFNTRGLTAGLRATYRILGGNDLARNGNFFDAAATVGGWF